ncbi:MAG: hypothetical protein AAF722_19255 [Cyanobacteria bacterium P01_C01_bin.70]
MQFSRKKIRSFLVGFVIAISLLGLVGNFVGPTKVFFPSLVGFSPVSENVYIDDITRAEKAKRLYSDAYEFTSKNIWHFERSPKVIFCTTQESLAKFGLSTQAAITFGTFGIVISPRGWKAYYVRHEMIHHVQIEQMGFVKYWQLPQWFIEGMAYSMSEDPRPQLSEPWETYRSDFENWYRPEAHDRLWEFAGKL